MYKTKVIIILAPFTLIVQLSQGKPNLYILLVFIYLVDSQFTIHGPININNSIRFFY